MWNFLLASGYITTYLATFVFVCYTSLKNVPGLLFEGGQEKE